MKEVRLKAHIKRSEIRVQTRNKAFLITHRGKKFNDKDYDTIKSKIGDNIEIVGESTIKPIYKIETTKKTAQAPTKIQKKKKFMGII